MDLPFDVWRHIATYLAPADLKPLIKVNRAFFDAVLNLLYRSIEFRCKDRKNFCEFIRLQDPFIASRVRMLSFAPTCFLPSLFDPQPGIFDKLILATRKAIWANNPRVMDFGTPQNVANKMDHIFRNLVYLDELELLCYDTATLSPIARTIIDSAWARLSTNIHTLTLDMSFRALEQAISPSLVFQRLETLTMKVSRISVTTDTDVMGILASVSLPFVTNHRQTLRHFILVDTQHDGFDFSPLLHNMGYFPHLKRVDASIVLNKSAPGLWHFLGLHSNMLETLGLSHHQFTEALPYDGPVLSALTTLSLVLTTPLHYNIDFISSLQQGNSITTLNLNSYMYCHAEMSKVLDIFASHQLRFLSTEFDFFSPQAADLLSERLPNLHTLSLRIDGYTDLGTRLGPSSQREHVFCEEMAKRDYSYWQIPVFNLETYRPNSARCDAVLKTLFPKIRMECFTVERRLQEMERSWWRAR